MNIYSVIESFGLRRSQHDPCIYIDKSSNTHLLVAVYVDDIIICNDNAKSIENFKLQLQIKVKVVDKGPLHYFFGLEIERDEITGSIKVNQRKFINELLTEYNMLSCRTRSTLLDPGTVFVCIKDNCMRNNTTRYQSLIGSLLFLAKHTSPDIIHTVSKLAQFNCNPHLEHFNMGKSV